MIITLVTQSSRSRYVDIPARFLVHFTNAINQDVALCPFSCFLFHRFPITLVQSIRLPTKLSLAKCFGEPMKMDCRNSGRKCISDLIIFNLTFVSYYSVEFCSKENKCHVVATWKGDVFYIWRCRIFRFHNPFSLTG